MDRESGVSLEATCSRSDGERELEDDGLGLDILSLIGVVGVSYVQDRCKSQSSRRSCVERWWRQLDES